MHWHLEKLMLDGVYQEIVVIYIHEETYVSYHFHFHRRFVVNWKRKTKQSLPTKICCVLDSYFIPGLGKNFASRLSVFNGGPFGVSRCGICERSE